MNIFQKEQKAIETIRAAYPNEPQMTLAKRIKSRSNFTADKLIEAAELAGGSRPLLSIYSVIRRFDRRAA